jgi:hypothetical protein
MHAEYADILSIQSKSDVLSEALINAGKALGLSQAVLGEAIGKDRTTIARRRIDPDSKAGELALLLIRCYRALYGLVGGKKDAMRHWMHTENRHTGGVPAEQVKSVAGLIRVGTYLEAIHSKG